MERVYERVERPAPGVVGRHSTRLSPGLEQSAAAGRRGDRLATLLGLFSLGLGAAQIIAPQAVTRLIGVRGNHRTLMRTMGLRQVAHGLGILTQRNKAPGVWSRVIGDAGDLALLGTAASDYCNDRARLGVAAASVAGVTGLDVITGLQLGRQNGAARAVHVAKSITINRPAHELYRFWRNFEALPRFMLHLKSVDDLGDGRSRWVARAPAGTEVAWTAEITADEADELIAWRALEDSAVYHRGVVRFEPAPAGRGTVVRVELVYHPPAGAFGVALARLLGEEPGQQVDADLRRFKQVMETGEVVRSDGAPLGTGTRLRRPAQPQGREQRAEAHW